jgi:hypothetical protein
MGCIVGAPFLILHGPPKFLRWHCSGTTGKADEDGGGRDLAPSLRGAVLGSMGTHPCRRQSSSGSGGLSRPTSTDVVARGRIWPDFSDGAE